MGNPYESYDGPKYPADTPRGHAKIEFAALQARALLEFAIEDQLPGEEILWRFCDFRIPVGPESYGLRYDVHEQLPDGELARTSFSPEQKCFEIVFSEATFKDLSELDPSEPWRHCRARFSLYHELGHVFLHPHEVKRIGEIPMLGNALRRQSKQLRPFEDVEWQANNFSAAIQAPALRMKALKGEGRLTLEVMMEEFQLSRIACATRFKTFTNYEEKLLRASWKAKAPGSPPRG